MEDVVYKKNEDYGQNQFFPLIRLSSYIYLDPCMTNVKAKFPRAVTHPELKYRSSR